MADDAISSAPKDGGNDTEPTPDGGDAFKPITSQADLDKIIGDRVARERGKYSDYEDLKSKAARLDEIEQANKSELEKANDRATAAERRAVEAEQQAMRSRVQASYGISNEDAELFLTASDAETLERQAAALAARSSLPRGFATATEGTGGTPDDLGDVQMVRRLFSSS